MAETINLDGATLRGYFSGASLSSYNYSIPLNMLVSESEGKVLDKHKKITAQLEQYGFKQGEHFSIEDGNLYLNDEVKKAVDKANHGYAIENRNDVNFYKDNAIASTLANPIFGIPVVAGLMGLQAGDMIKDHRYSIEMPSSENKEAFARLSSQIDKVDPKEYIVLPIKNIT